MRTTRVTGEMKPYLYLHTRHKTIEKSEKFEFWRGAIKGKKKKEKRKTMATDLDTTIHCKFFLHAYDMIQMIKIRNNHRERHSILKGVALQSRYYICRCVIVHPFTRYQLIINWLSFVFAFVLKTKSNEQHSHYSSLYGGVESVKVQS